MAPKTAEDVLNSLADGTYTIPRRGFRFADEDKQQYEKIPVAGYTHNSFDKKKIPNFTVRRVADHVFQFQFGAPTEEAEEKKHNYLVEKTLEVMTSPNWESLKKLQSKITAPIEIEVDGNGKCVIKHPDGCDDILRVQFVAGEDGEVDRFEFQIQEKASKFFKVILHVHPDAVVVETKDVPVDTFFSTGLFGINALLILIRGEYPFAFGKKKRETYFQNARILYENSASWSRSKFDGTLWDGNGGDDLSKQRARRYRKVLSHKSGKFHRIRSEDMGIVENPSFSDDEEAYSDDEEANGEGVDEDLLDSVETDAGSFCKGCSMIRSKIFWIVAVAVAVAAATLIVLTIRFINRRTALRNVAKVEREVGAFCCAVAIAAGFAVLFVSLIARRGRVGHGRRIGTKSGSCGDIELHLLHGDSLTLIV